MWHPIETAPRDGTHILVRYDHPYSASDEFSSYIPRVAFWGNYHPNALGKACWRDTHTRAKFAEPDLWMPLPEAHK